MQERLFSFVTVQMRYACMYIVYVFCIYKIYYINHFILFHKHPKNEGLLFLMVLTLKLVQNNLLFYYCFSEEYQNWCVDASWEGKILY